MSTFTPTIGEWTSPLHKFALSVSLASLLLVPTVRYPIPPIKQQWVQSEIDFIVALPDGYVDLRTLYYPTRSGLETPTIRESVANTGENIEYDSIPHILRDMSGLSVEVLASLAHVSRNAYYKWLDGKGVSDEHIVRLTELLNTFRTIYDLRGPDLKEFLEIAGPAGRPIDLLTAGNNEAVIGLALRPLSSYIDVDSVSNTAHNISGLSGWLHPAVKLNWGTPQLSTIELDHALDQLSPEPRVSQVESLSDVDEDEEAFMAWGLVLE